jgi:CRP/FNR family transcriptional regulator, cyclic AMP receptor protein
MSGTFAERFPMLRHASLLRKLPDGHFEGLLAVMQLKRIKPGDVIIHQGYLGDSMAIIAKGAFRVTVQPPGGKETEVNTLVPGDVVGDMACVDPAPRSATVTATTESQVFFMNRAMLLNLRTKGPSVLQILLRGVTDQVTERIRSTDRRLDDALARLEEETLEMHSSGEEPFPESVALRPVRHTGAIDIGGVAGLEEFSPADVGVMVEVCRQLSFPKGALLCKEGEKGDTCYVVIQGDVGVYRAVSGSQHLLASVSSCLLGQMAMVSPAPRSATLRAETEVVALELSRDTLSQLLGQNSAFALRFLELVAINGIRQLRIATERLAKEAAQEPPPAPAPDPRQQPYPRTVDQAIAQPEANFGRLARDPSRSKIETGTHRTLSHAARPRHADKREIAKETRRKLTKIRPETQKDAAKHTIAYMQASLQEWGMSMDDLDNISVSRPDGMMSAAETKARTNRR